LDYVSGQAVWQLAWKFRDNPQFIPDVRVAQSMQKEAWIAAVLCIVQLRQFLPIVAHGELSHKL
jgi:hypothetical protein